MKFIRAAIMMGIKINNEAKLQQPPQSQILNVCTQCPGVSSRAQNLCALLGKISKEDV